jgi:hypothetical protein
VHIGKSVEGGAVVSGAGTAASAVDMDPVHQETASQEAVVESAVGLESMAIAQYQVERSEADHCSRMDVLAAVEVQDPDDPPGTANGAPEVDSGAGLVGEVRCEAVVLEGTVGSDTPGRCTAGAETAGIAEVVERAAGRDLAAERPKRWEDVMLWAVGGPGLPASCEEMSRPVHSAVLQVPAQAAVFRLVSAHCWTDHCERHSGRAAGSLRAGGASVLDAVTSWAA